MEEQKNEERDESDWEELTGGLWQPEVPEETMVGAIISIRDGDYGKQWVFEIPDGYDYHGKPKFKEITTPSHKVLQERMAPVVPGDEVRITYKGEKPTGKGNPVRIYKVTRAPKPKKPVESYEE